MTEIPAAMLKKKTSHMTANSRDWTQRKAEPASSGSSEPWLPGKLALNFDGGLRNIRLHGIRTQAKMTPSHTKRSGRSPSVRTTRKGASPLLRTTAPTPKPMMTIPVASPLRSGNHFATVATGVT